MTGKDWRIVRGAGATLRGPVVGGHLGTVRALVGTDYLPDLDGAILILEEVFVGWVDIGWVDIDAARTHRPQPDPALPRQPDRDVMSTHDLSLEARSP